MPLDPRIKDAITEAAKEQRQGKELTSKLIAWFDALADGNTTLDDRDSVYRRLELLFESTKVPTDRQQD